jgi:hypothetical protein
MQEDILNSISAKGVSCYSHISLITTKKNKILIKMKKSNIKKAFNKQVLQH